MAISRRKYKILGARNFEIYLTYQNRVAKYDNSIERNENDTRLSARCRERPLLKSDDTPGREKICQQLTTTIQDIIHRSQPDPLKFSNRHQVGSAELACSRVAHWTDHNLLRTDGTCAIETSVNYYGLSPPISTSVLAFRHSPWLTRNLVSIHAVDSKEEEEGIKAFAEGNHPFRVLRLPFLLHFDIVQGIRSIRTDFFLFGFRDRLRKNWR